MKNLYTLFFVLLTGILTVKAQTNTIANTLPPAENEEQPGTIKGKVITTDGQPAAFVNVTLKEIKKGTITTEDGLFVLHHVKKGNYTLVISHTGLETQEKPVSINTGETLEFNLTLKETSKQLDAVIVEGRRSPNERPVTIGKMPIAPIDLPQSVSIIGQGIIKDQQALRLSDVVKNINGIYLGTTRGNTQEAFFARGYGFGANNMFKNGARVNSGVMPEMSGLDRVEVLKGSAAILYGNVSPGGILNMVTKQPKFNFGGEVSMRMGSYDLFKPAFDIYGPINSNIAYRLNGTFEKANSYRDHVHSKRYYVNPSFLFRLGKRTELVVEGDYLNHEFTPDFGIGSYRDTLISPVGRNTFFGVPWQYAKSQQATTTVSVKHQLNDNWNLNSSLSYQQYKRDYYSIERIQFGKNDDWGRPLNKIGTAENYYVGQVNLNGKFKTGAIVHNLLAGVDADKNRLETKSYNNPTLYDSINLFNPNKFPKRTDMPAADSVVTLAKTPTVRFGAYIQNLISLSDKWKLLAGIRWSYQDAQAVTTTNYRTGVVTKGTLKTDKAFSPRVGLVYKPRPTTAIFASYANSFTTNSGTDIYLQTLKPSIIDQFELGIKNDLLNGKLTFNVTAYRIINQNLAQTAQFTATGQENSNTTIKELTGQTTSDGVEVDVTAHPVTGLNILAGYSYNYMRYTKTDASRKGNFKEGERLVSTPAHTANASVFYTFSTTALKGLKIGATGLYIGDRVGGWNNSISQTQKYDRRIPVEGFVTVDLSAGYTWNNISLLAKVSNLTNTFNYYVHENYSVNPIAPRQFITTVAYRF